MTQLPRRCWRPLDAVLLLDKPRDITSNRALQTVRRLFCAAKAGHTGTLDPFATGLLPLCFGEATKFSQGLFEADKRYVAGLVLGIRTDSGDSDGKAVGHKPVSVTLAQVTDVLARFVGEIEQIPPMYSALKFHGRPLYELARQGVEVERTPRKVRIYSIDLLRFPGERIEIEVHCSKGTYIRTLADDIGAALGCGAHLDSLRRTAIAKFHVDDAHSLAALQQAPSPELARCLLPVDTLVQELERADLEPDLADRFSHGQTVPVLGLSVGALCRVYGRGRFIGVARAQQPGLLAPTRLLAHPCGE
jgi:tRNA pseudouridine55 synthase